VDSQSPLSGLLISQGYPAGGWRYHRVLRLLSILRAPIAWQGSDASKAPNWSVDSPRAWSIHQYIPNTPPSLLEDNLLWAEEGSFPEITFRHPKPSSMAGTIRRA
jgi:hypothetical protein